MLCTKQIIWFLSTPEALDLDYCLAMNPGLISRSIIDTSVLHLSRCLLIKKTTLLFQSSKTFQWRNWDYVTSFLLIKIFKPSRSLFLLAKLNQSGSLMYRGQLRAWNKYLVSREGWRESLSIWISQMGF